MATPASDLAQPTALAPVTSGSDPTTDPVEAIPELATYIATDPDEIRAAHRLVADSVAQQRQLAARAIIFHPVWLGAMVAVCAVVYKLLYHDSSDWPLIGTTSAGCVMAGLTVVRVFTGGYIEQAERVGTRAWLLQEEAETEKEMVEKSGRADIPEQTILVTKFGDRIIGALIVKGVREGRKIYGVIRAWTVLQKYRGKGVGMGLLEEAVQLCQTRRWKGPEFDERHANAKRVLPALFNRPFEKRERRARAALDRLVRKR